MGDKTKIEWADATRPKVRLRERNNNWKGGKSLAPNGYLLIRVGVDHPMADVRGYAYEHRIVASNKIGRTLKKKEVVHHIDSNKLNNDPENLEIKESIAHHRAEHRTRGFNNRLPGEKNPTMQCECGCGLAFKKFDKSGRPRRFVSGHNLRQGVL